MCSIEEVRHSVMKGHFKLPPRLAELAVWTFENPERVAFGSIRSIASDFGVAGSTVQRLVASLGFASFKLMKVQFQIYLRGRSVALPTWS